MEQVKRSTVLLERPFFVNTKRSGSIRNDEKQLEMFGSKGLENTIKKLGQAEELKEIKHSNKEYRIKQIFKLFEI